MLIVQLTKRRDEFVLDLDFTAPTRGVTALFGRSGCGKSTTIALMAGLLTPDSGRVQVGDDVLFDSDRGIDLPPHERRIGVVFQDSRLFPHYSVRGNLRYGARRRRDGTATRVRFDDVVSLLGLGNLLDRRPFELSGGEKQRVALGRALLAEPRLLLLDEPLASLDAARREDVLPYFERLRDAFEICMVYVTHQFDEVLRLATRVVLLENGRTLASGDIADVSRLPALRAIVGPDAVGAVLTGVVDTVTSTGLATMRIGDSTLSFDVEGVRAGQRIQIQVLARDVIVALEPPRALSVRNVVAARILSITPDVGNAVLVELEVGGAARLLARITARASTELQLASEMQAWVLIKAVSLRGHVFSAPAR